MPTTIQGATTPNRACDGATASASAINTLKMLVRYKRWANGLTFKNVLELPEGEALRQRPTRFGSMVHTLNHVYVVDDIFRHHLQGKKHGYTARNTEHTPTVRETLQNVQPAAAHGMIHR